jgi:hypothetical protein
MTTMTPNSVTSNFYYLHIEGMDLAGKSTATKAVQSQIDCNWTIRHNTIQAKSKFHKIVDDLRLSGTVGNDELGQLYYHVLKDDLSRFEYPTVNTIQDSTVLLRSLSWNEARNKEELSEQFLGLIDQHPKFTKSVILIANIKTRQSRLQSRIDEAPHTVASDDMLVVNDPKLFLKMEEALVYYSTTYFDSKIIDTSDLTKSEVSQAVCEHLFA